MDEAVPTVLEMDIVDSIIAMTTDLEEVLYRANQRLKAQNVGISIEQDGSKLCLRGTFPPKPGGEQTRPSRQRIYPGIRASIDGVRLIEKEAHRVRFAIEEKRFDWRAYTRIAGDTKAEALPANVNEWICSFEEDYFNRRHKSEQTLTTWRTEYQLVFRRLPQDVRLTPALLKETILKTPPDTKTRKRFCICLGALAKFAGIPLDVKALRGDYNPKRVTPRNVPDDAVIAEWFYKIDSPAWRWIYGMMATFGLRNHEVFRLDFEALKINPVCAVLAGKTGERTVWPFHPEWFQEFKLHQVELPAVNLNRSNPALGHEPTQFFHRHHFPFPPYALRHAWAIRTLEYGLDISLASQQMGHSLKIHSDLYHHWISSKQHQRAFDALLKKPNRPLPP